MLNRKYLVAVVAFMFALNVVFPFSLFAQDTPTPDAEGPAVISLTTPTPTPVIVEPPPPDPVTEEPGDPPATTPENLLGQIFQLLKDSTYMVWAAAGVIVIVGAIKMVLGALGVAIEDNSAVVLTLIVQVVIWLAYAAANYFGQGETFKAWYSQIVDVIRSLLPLFGAIFLGHIGYQAASKRNVPVIGYYPPAKTTH